MTTFNSYWTIFRHIEVSSTKLNTIHIFVKSVSLAKIKSEHQLAAVVVQGSIRPQGFQYPSQAVTPLFENQAVVSVSA